MSLYTGYGRFFLHMWRLDRCIFFFVYKITSVGVLHKNRVPKLTLYINPEYI
ncbi:hypothetical protein ACJX0J_017592, partial [Zea mays]